MDPHLLDELSKSIGARLLIQFEYLDREYIVEPHLLGRNHDKQDTLLAWVVSGAMKQDLSNGNWQTFILGEVFCLKILEQRFSKQRPGYDPYDSSMSRIYYRI